MAKAYDRVEWSFLRKMMLALGFHDGWVELIMKCVTTVSYNIQGSERCPPISHLFFADDSLLFFKANVEEAVEVKRCLSVYEDLSGQAPNFGKYLGPPSFVGRHKKAVFAYIEDKIRQRIGPWNKKLLSQAGKEILLKTVAQSMPTFSMSVFLLPISVCTAIERIMNRYWWDSGTDRRIHWKAWDKLCIPKKYGGWDLKICELLT
ncbi:PREDICTED: uncharacterized protein LOC109191090 [Ipomoea nil]|uniref:uncharacterized protein LOC109191090 n=1 Tax=Ipomoea nil TaxID=35883 RepID=UPI000901C5F7|nr:PREDICTED: uncharacterized protein LOC109191090 [Ipomoea nil]